ncbi:hypothetical protein PPL_06020 [Heterostelium album PN500]|uniref:Uncharacterized protein n=1 Tax=Heterostelium pallidum (strain ATCC 26659 / Pp 5 / PN500) TaxID=670386 RepID=D3BC00_HETP5|nr:hypothetical protein PPL_06020 [Heterostelium album PN500]EFA81183.1 hypothetical protein PPL_06020 [Heterostelium album PN500]|eukprot:XP_020433301.1 hypothetical protein PPL_06020 [Heterostelium album PN500]
MKISLVILMLSVFLALAFGVSDKVDGGTPVECLWAPSAEFCQRQGKVLVPQTRTECAYCKDPDTQIYCFWLPTEEFCASQGKVLVPQTRTSCGYCADPTSGTPIQCLWAPTAEFCQRQGKILVPQTPTSCAYCADPNIIQQIYQSINDLFRIEDSIDSTAKVFKTSSIEHILDIQQDLDLFLKNEMNFHNLICPVCKEIAKEDLVTVYQIKVNDSDIVYCRSCVEKGTTQNSKYILDTDEGTRTMKSIRRKLLRKYDNIKMKLHLFRKELMVELECPENEDEPTTGTQLV